MMNDPAAWQSNRVTSIQHALPSNQQGATLIVVLMMVLLLAMIGAMVVRNSMVSADMTTSAQVNQLLMQSSDVPLTQLDISNIEPGVTATSTLLGDMAKDDTGPVALLKTEGSKDNEYVLCYQPTVRSELYQRGEHRVMVNATATRNAGAKADGYCRLSQNTAYTSARGTVASQVAMTRPTLNGDDLGIGIKPLSTLDIGSDNGTVGKSDAAYFRAYVTSVVPDMSLSSSSNAIEECMSKPIGGMAGNTVNDNQIRCLDRTDTPVNIQVQDYAYNIEAN